MVRCLVARTRLKNARTPKQVILMPDFPNSKAHKTLMRLIAANIILDIIAIAIWAALPAGTWNGMYRLDSLIASVEAAVAAALFAVTLFALKKQLKWAPIIAITLTITQRAFAIYVFYPSYFIPIPLVWSIVIIYYALKDLQKN
jgi:hypothetical protein